MQLEVAELVGEHRQHLARAHRLEQGVEEHDPLLPEEPGEVGVAVGGATRGVHHEDAARAEADAPGQGDDPVAELALGQRGELVEERGEEGRIDPGREKAEGARDHPCPEPPRRARLLHDREDGGRDGRAEGGPEGQSFQEVQGEATQGLAVEAVLLFDDERAVEGERQLEQGAQQTQDGKEEEARRHGTAPEGRRQAAGASLRPPEAGEREEGQGDQHFDPSRDPPEAVAVLRVGDSFLHLIVRDPQDAARLGLARGVAPIAPVQGGERVLGEDLREAQGDEEKEERVHRTSGTGRAPARNSYSSEGGTTPSAPGGATGGSAPTWRSRATSRAKRKRSPSATG